MVGEAIRLDTTRLPVRRRFQMATAPMPPARYQAGSMTMLRTACGASVASDAGTGPMSSHNPVNWYAGWVRRLARITNPARMSGASQR